MNKKYKTNFNNNIIKYNFNNILLYLIPTEVINIYYLNNSYRNLIKKNKLFNKNIFNII